MNKYTSLKLSKLLADNGFKGESRMWWTTDWHKKDGYELVRFETTNPKSKVIRILCPAYDILNKLCVKYAKEMFGEEWIDISKKSGRYADGVELKAKHYYPEIILSLFQQNKKDEAEEYIWKHCLFNPKNNL